MPETELTINLKIRHYTLFDFTPVLPAVGILVHIGRWWTLAVGLGAMYWSVSRGPLGWRVKFRMDR